MPRMTDDQMASFLEKPRHAVLLRTNRDGTAHGAPIWFDWNGQYVRMISDAAAPKVAELERDPRASALVSNDVGEPGCWVRFDGTVVVDRAEDARAFATDLLAPRYWDLEDQRNRELLDQWRAAPQEAFVMLRLEPSRIVSAIT